MNTRACTNLEAIVIRIDLTDQFENPANDVVGILAPLHGSLSLGYVTIFMGFSSNLTLPAEQVFTERFGWDRVEQVLVGHPGYFPNIQKVRLVVGHSYVPSPRETWRPFVLKRWKRLDKGRLLELLI